MKLNTTTSNNYGYCFATTTTESMVNQLKSEIYTDLLPFLSLLLPIIAMLLYFAK